MEYKDIIVLHIKYLHFFATNWWNSDPWVKQFVRLYRRPSDRDQSVCSVIFHFIYFHWVLFVGATIEKGTISIRTSTHWQSTSMFTFLLLWFYEHSTDWYIWWEQFQSGINCLISSECTKCWSFQKPPLQILKLSCCLVYHVTQKPPMKCLYG